MNRTSLILGWLTILNRKVNRIMATQEELTESLVALTAQVDKSRAEIVAAVAALEEALANAGTVGPEVLAALDDLRVAVQSVDDLNADPV